MSELGHVYLLHFERPIGRLDNPRAQARHYIGWTAGELDVRLDVHRGGGADAARIMAHLAREGIAWHLVRVWRGDVALKKRIKALKAGNRLCPACAAPGRLMPLRELAACEVAA